MSKAEEARKKRGLRPKLRFPEFEAAGEWEEKALKDISEQILEKVGTVKLTPVSITAGYGFVSQAEKFGRDISGEQYKNYIFLRRGDFAYNKGNSKKFPQGYVCQLKEFEQAAASSVFVCFRLNKYYLADFLQGLFDRNIHGIQLAKHITSSARSDGLLNIKSEVFFNIKIPIPYQFEEQQKIADCLASVDELITAEAQKIEALKAHKKGLLQQLFPADDETTPSLRFPEFRESAGWEERRLEDISNNISSGKDQGDTNGKYDLYGSTGIIGKTLTDTYKGEFILVARVGANAGFLTKINGQFGVTDNALVLHVNKLVVFEFVFYYLLNFGLNSLIFGSGQPLITGGQLKKLFIFLPDKLEQQKIADCLASLDELITAHTQKLEALKTHKKGLMQQLFPSPDQEGNE